MKFKHFLRGLGAGIIFATLVLTITFSLKGYKMSEAAIVEEALELGMVWPDRNNNKETVPTTPDEQETSTTVAPTSSQIKETTSESESASEQITTKEPVTVEPTTPAPTTEASTTEEPTTTEVPTTTELPTTTEVPTTTEPPTTTELPTTTEAESTTPKPPQIIAGKSIITVPKGMNSIQVAKLLETAGAVRDAYDFDKYIERQGYGGKIQIGTHEIPLGSSYDEIIKIICGLK